MSKVATDSPATIRCKSKLFKIGSWTIFWLPKSASTKLPSRGQVMVTGTLNGHHFQAIPLEPDGNWSHWFSLNAAMLRTTNLAAGETATLEITPTEHWPEPDVPADIQRALNAAPEARALWERVTPMSRWEWIRWIHSTGSQETRARRIKVACSKLESGKRRPCCWNRNMRTEPAVSKNGVLLAPAQINS